MLPVVITFLEPIEPETVDTGVDESHPMRAVTQGAAFDPASWTPERKANVAELFDDLAAEWHTRLTAGRMASVDDALARGGVSGACALEVGSGTGFATPHIAATFDRVIALDLSLEMLRLAPAEVAPRVLGDASVLPLADNSVDAVVLVNALLFPAEMDRVLRPDGAVVWVNSIGTSTPIYLVAEDVVRALPGDWEGLASQRGPGTWTVARRRQPKAPNP